MSKSTAAPQDTGSRGRLRELLSPRSELRSSTWEAPPASFHPVETREALPERVTPSPGDAWLVPSFELAEELIARGADSFRVAVDRRGDLDPRLQLTLDHMPIVQDHATIPLRVADAKTKALTADLAAVARLTARFAVEGRAVEHDDDGLVLGHLADVGHRGAEERPEDQLRPFGNRRAGGLRGPLRRAAGVARDQLEIVVPGIEDRHLRGPQQGLAEIAAATTTNHATVRALPVIMR